MIESLAAKVYAGGRLTKQEGLALLREGDLLDLAQLAQRVRDRLNPGGVVTFVVDSNPNYTNICENNCTFCAFWREAGSEGAYTLSVDELLEKFRAAAGRGVRTILLQGGVNGGLPMGYFRTLVERTCREVPQIHPHFFSPPEIRGMAKQAGLTIREVLQELWEAGLRTIPGGGAEILSDRVKSLLCPRKGTTADWLEVMREAHKIGFKTTATMMFGHLEEDEDIIDHLEAIRALQDESGGFTAFIPWSFKRENSPLGAKVTRPPSPTRYLRLLALARIYLDNFPHIQASWFSEGKKIGQAALHFGADDFGGTLFEEHVHRAAAHVLTITLEELVSLIHEAGFQAAERNTFYHILQVFPGK